MQQSNDVIYALILAAGRSRRMSGQAKALTPLVGLPMLQHVIDRVQPQVSDLAINAPATPHYQAFDKPVIEDQMAGFHGPLMGLFSGLNSAWCQADYLLNVPCDGPFVPFDLAQVLHQAAQANNADVAVIRYQQQLQPMFSLWHTRSKAAVERALFEHKQGGFKSLLGKLNTVYVDWPSAEQTTAINPFFNINTPQDILSAEQLLSRS